MIETDDFLADLERHLRDAAQRRDDGAPVRRRRLPRRRFTAVAVALALLGVAAVVTLGRGLASPADEVAATPPSATPSKTPAPPSAHVDAQGRGIAERAARDLASARACRTAPDAVPAPVDTRLSPAIGNLLPGLASGPGADPAALRLEPMTARGVLRSSVRELPLGPDLKLTVYVLDGLPVGRLDDPAACLRARLARVASLSAGQPAAIRRAAESHARGFRDTAPDLQTLMLQVARTGRQGSSGVGLPVWSRHALEPAVALNPGKEGGAYVGIAERRAAHVVVHARAPFTVPVVQGFYGFVLSGRTGHVSLDEVAADGTVVRTHSVR